jgi:hypothetical protein
LAEAITLETMALTAQIATLQRGLAQHPITD